MTEPIASVRPVQGDRRRSARRRSDAVQAAASAGYAATAAAPAAIEAPQPHPAPEASPAAFAAQVMGQGGHKRGLRGGPPALEQARSAYLEAEWSGPVDRRPPRGAVSQTRI